MNEMRKRTQRSGGPRRRPARHASAQRSPAGATTSVHTSTGSRLAIAPPRPMRSARRAQPKSNDKIPPLARDTIRVVPLGGVEEVGNNMTAIEYGDDIIVFDVGFQFEEEGAPGVDYIIPNTTYLEERKDKIRAIIITHGHLDHIGGIPYIMERIGNPPIYTRYLTSLMINKRHAEFPNLAKPDIRIVEPGDKMRIASFDLEYFNVTHSIPDSMGTIVKTLIGNVVVSGDLRLDHIDEEPTDEEKKVWEHVGSQDNLLFISDSTSAELPGWSIPERKIIDNLDGIIGKIPGRILIGTFASQFARLVRIINIAEKYGRKVVTEGRSIKTNIEIAREAGLLQIKDDTIIPIEEMKDYSPDKILILATGAQGEEFAALNRMASGTHKHVALNDRDTLILSSSVIPGNEMPFQRLKDKLYRCGIDIIHYRVSDVHASGHGRIEELKWIHGKVGAKYFMPSYGYHSMLRAYSLALQHAGFPKEDIIITDNGNVVEMNKDGFKILKEKAPSTTRVVEGPHVRDIQEVVMIDRKALAKDGMFVVVATVNMRMGKLRKSPDIVSRGFVYLRESRDLLDQARLIVKRIVEKAFARSKTVNIDDVKKDLSNELSRFLLQQTHKNPIVIPVIVGV